MKYKLMIKTHQITGLKYLCVTTRNNYHEYSGSGKAWKDHLIKNGRKWNTELIFESDDIIEFSRMCLEKSLEYNIVGSTDWANIILEHGGGEYPVDETGHRIQRVRQELTKEELDEIARTSNWYECSVCNARMTELAFINHRCKNFSMIPFDYQEYQKTFHLT